MRPQPLIAVTDVEASSRWYQRLLGCRSAHGGAEYERLVSGDALVLQLHRWDVEHHHGPIGDPGSRPYGNGVLLWFEVDDFDAAVARAAEMVVEIVKPPHRNPPDGSGGPDHRECWLRDLEGYTVVLASPDGEAGRRESALLDAAATLSRQAGDARRDNRLADAHRDLVSAIALLRQTGATRELVHALKALGQIARDLGPSDAARPLFEEAIAICRRGGDTLTLAHTIRHLADVHREAGRAKDAEPLYREALALYRGDPQTRALDLANAIRPLALLKDAAGEVQAATPMWEEARALYEAADVPAGIAECSARLARPDGTAPV